MATHTESKVFTVKQINSAFVRSVKLHGETTRMCEFIWKVYHDNANEGLKLVMEVARGFGAGGENTVPYKAHSSFKTLFARTGSRHDKPEVIRWKRSSDAVITDVEHEYTAPKVDNDKPDTGKPETTSTVEEVKPVKLTSVKNVVDYIMDHKPKRMKVSTIIIALLSQLGKGGLVEVATAVNKLVDKAIDAEIAKQEKAA